MDNVDHLLGTAQSFFLQDDFFHYHGLYLGLIWMFGIIIGILIRKVSRFLHAIAFFFIDVVTIFFIVGAIIRLYPRIDQFWEWSLIKQGHTVGGITTYT